MSGGISGFGRRLIQPNGSSQNLHMIIVVKLVLSVIERLWFVPYNENIKDSEQKSNDRGEITQIPFLSSINRRKSNILPSSVPVGSQVPVKLT